MKKFPNSFIGCVLAFVLVFSLVGCNNNDNKEGATTLLPEQQIIKAKEILTKATIKTADLGISQTEVLALASYSSNNSAEPKNKQEVVDVLNSQGLKGLATDSSTVSTMTTDMAKKLFMALYAVINTGLSQILELTGTNGVGTLYEVDYELAEEFKGFGVLIFNPIAFRGTEKIVENGKNGYILSATVKYSMTPEGSTTAYQVDGTVQIKYFDESDYSLNNTLVGKTESGLYTINSYFYDKATKSYEENCVVKNSATQIFGYYFHNDKMIPPSTYDLAQNEILEFAKNQIETSFAAQETAINQNYPPLKSTVASKTYTDANGEQKPLKVKVSNPFAS